ncbi:hypothetical protein VTJ04DRAFT_2449 [Mycothermus thermophilus]|uniref:uncharacterized protein n=1 Tax=Humicola insolens TaxID=85995 RepID=UPI0037433863
MFTISHRRPRFHHSTFINKHSSDAVRVPAVESILAIFPSPPSPYCECQKALLLAPAGAARPCSAHWTPGYTAGAAAAAAAARLSAPSLSISSAV